MFVNPVELLSTDALRPNGQNPKKPMGLKYKKGLRKSLDRFGFAGLLIVAENADGTYEVLDGNTRLDELARDGVERVPCVVYRNMDAAARREFVLAHDRHRKVFDEEAVLAQLQELVDDGRELKELAELSGVDNLERLLGEMAAAAPPTPTEPTVAMASLVLYGPAEEVKKINQLLKQVKGNLSTLEKARKALAEAAKFLDWSDERLLGCLLAAVASYGESDDGEG